MKLPKAETTVETDGKGDRGAEIVPVTVAGGKERNETLDQDCPIHPPGLGVGMSWKRKLRHRMSQRAMGPCVGFTIDAYEEIKKDSRYSEGMKTFEVTEKVVKPVTKKWQCSFATYLVSVKSFENHIANCFVSHAWAYPFSVLLETMRSDAQRRLPEPTYFWCVLAFGVSMFSWSTCALSCDSSTNPLRAYAYPTQRHTIHHFSSQILPRAG